MNDCLGEGGSGCISLNNMKFNINPRILFKFAEMF